MGDGGAEESSAIGDQMHVHIFESLQLEGSYVGDLLYFSSQKHPALQDNGTAYFLCNMNTPLLAQRLAT